MIAFISIIIILTVWAIMYFASEVELGVVFLFSMFLFIEGVLLVLTMQGGKTYDQGVKDTLNHKNNYRINYQKVNDSTFIPIDTVIIK